MEPRGEWRRDPSGRHDYRYWDGWAFTEWVGDNGDLSEDAGPIPDASPVIEVGLPSPERQNRWTVGFRLILAIPVIFWAGILSIAALSVLVIGWFGALFMGRLPDWVATFLSRFLQYYTRVAAYLYLMTDKYPPFSLSDDTYPVTVQTHPGELNRVAVFFRLILFIPVYFMASWLGAGLAISMIVIWIVILAKGRMPGVAAQAVGATLRFLVRVYGYGMLVTSAYPSGLYGDRDEPRDQMQIEAGDVSEPSMPVARPRTARIQLSPGARRLVTTFLVIGIVQNIATQTLNFRADGVERSQPVSQEARGR